MTAKISALCLLLLALTPVTGPFSTGDGAARLRHVRLHSGAYARRVRREPATIAEIDLSAPPGTAGGRGFDRLTAQPDGRLLLVALKAIRREAVSPPATSDQPRLVDVLRL